MDAYGTEFCIQDPVDWSHILHAAWGWDEENHADSLGIPWQWKSRVCVITVDMVKGVAGLLPWGWKNYAGFQRLEDAFYCNDAILLLQRQKKIICQQLLLNPVSTAMKSTVFDIRKLSVIRTREMSRDTCISWDGIGRGRFFAGTDGDWEEPLWGQVET